jgi:Protein of unknown function (DUF4239)
MELARLLWWIESHSPATIALITFGISYASAAVVFAFSRAIASHRFAAALKATTPVMLTPLAVLMGLVIAFVASRIWGNYDRAYALVRDEARAIQAVLTLGETLPPKIPTELRGAIQHYLQFTIDEEWPAMLQGRAKMLATVPGLMDAMSAILSFTPTDASQQLTQQRTLIALEQAIDARRNRILLSNATVAPMQWIAIIILAGLLLLTVAMVHIDQPLAKAMSLFILSTAIAVCTLLLLVNDRPFHAGGFFIGPDVLKQIQLN